jgi:hypothetical protein
VVSSVSTLGRQGGHAMVTAAQPDLGRKSVVEQASPVGREPVVVCTRSVMQEVGLDVKCKDFSDIDRVGT